MLGHTPFRQSRSYCPYAVRRRCPCLFDLHELKGWSLALMVFLLATTALYFILAANFAQSFEAAVGGWTPVGLQAAMSLEREVRSVLPAAETMRARSSSLRRDCELLEEFAPRGEQAARAANTCWGELMRDHALHAAAGAELQRTLAARDAVVCANEPASRQLHAPRPCIDPGRASQAFRAADPGLACALRVLFAGGSVLEVGAGLGAYGAALTSAAPCTLPRGDLSPAAVAAAEAAEEAAAAGGPGAGAAVAAMVRGSGPAVEHPAPLLWRGIDHIPNIGALTDGLVAPIRLEDAASIAGRSRLVSILAAPLVPASAAAAGFAEDVAGADATHSARPVDRRARALLWPSPALLAYSRVVAPVLWSAFARVSGAGMTTTPRLAATALPYPAARSLVGDGLAAAIASPGSVSAAAFRRRDQQTASSASASASASAPASAFDSAAVGGSTAVASALRALRSFFGGGRDAAAAAARSALLPDEREVRRWFELAAMSPSEGSRQARAGLASKLKAAARAGAAGAAAVAAGGGGGGGVQGGGRRTAPALAALSPVELGSLDHPLVDWALSIDLGDRVPISEQESLAATLCSVALKGFVISWTPDPVACSDDNQSYFGEISEASIRKVKGTASSGAPLRLSSRCLTPELVEELFERAPACRISQAAATVRENSARLLSGLPVVVPDASDADAGRGSLDTRPLFVRYMPGEQDLRSQASTPSLQFNVMMFVRLGAGVGPSLVSSSALTPLRPPNR